MKIGIMQPYFFPYIGYWQLMNAVDKFVVYDDVNYIVRGWINRNRIIINNEVHYIHLPICSASRNKLINEINVSDDSRAISSVLRTIELAYKKAPYFYDTFPIIEKSFELKGSSISEFMLHSFHLINKYLGIDTELLLSSSLAKDNTLKGEEKILEICRMLYATEYYNAIGGRKLYAQEHFARAGIALSFLNPDEISYKQFGDSFFENLSLIDVMMFNSKEIISRMLGNFSLVSLASD